MKLSRVGAGVVLGLMVGAIVVTGIHIRRERSRVLAERAALDASYVETVAALPAAAPPWGVPPEVPPRVPHRGTIRRPRGRVTVSETLDIRGFAG